MALIVELEIITDQLSLTETAAAVPDVTLRIEDILIPPSDRPALLIWAEGEEFRDLEKALDEDDTVFVYSTLGVCQSRRLYRVELTNRSAYIYIRLIRADASLIAAIITDTHWDMRARFANREAFARFYNSLELSETTLCLTRIAETTSESSNSYSLTQKQRDTLLEAHKAGYFEIPRTTSLEEIGTRLGISAPSVSKQLRRAEDRLIKHTIGFDEDDL